jgi:membrane-bound serine protease (ClpP class)
VAVRRIGFVNRRLPCVLLLAAALLGLGGHPARAATPSVSVVKVQGVIDPALSAFVRGAIRSAERDRSVLVLQIDSRGAYGDRGLELAKLVRSAAVPVVAWVGPSGARAEGGALFVVYAADVVAVAPGAGIGPARPFDLGAKASEEAASDITRNASALRGLALGAGAPAVAIDRMVEGAAFAAGPAQRAGAAGVVAVSIPDLLRLVDGRVVGRGPSGQERLVTLNREGRSVEVRFGDLGFFERVLHAVSTPTAVYVLLVLGLWGVAFEFTQPGIGMAGIAGAIAVGLAAYGLTVISVGWWGLALLLAGMGMQVLDVAIKRVQVLTLAGTAAFFAGSWLAWSAVAPAVDLALWLVVFMTVAGFLLFGFGFTVALKARERVRSAQVGLVGLTGEVRSDLNPEGGVFVKGALWRARSLDGPIRAGTRIRVRGIDGLILQVEEEVERPDQL